MKGHCNCGAVSFNVTGTISKLYQCRCTLCQKQSGSTSNTATMVNQSRFEWCSGTEDISHWKKPSGFTSDFCKNCGSPVPNQLRDTPYYWIPMGLIDPEQSIDAVIVAHICCDTQASWDRHLENVLVLDGMPDSVEGFIENLQEQ